MKPILQAAIAAALATGGLLAAEPKPGAPPALPAPDDKPKTPAVPAPTEPAPTEPAPTEPAPTEPAPTEPETPPTPNPLAPPAEAEDPPKSTDENPLKTDVPAPPTPPDKKPVAKPAVKPSVKDNSGVDEVRKKGPLHFAAGSDLPLSGKMVLFGEDGAKQREVVYQNGEIQSWTEWHANNVKIERTYAAGKEVKRTGWQGERKWFEITFATAGEATAPKPPAETGPDTKPAETTEPDEKGVDPKTEPSKVEPPENPEPTKEEPKADDPPKPTKPADPAKPNEPAKPEDGSSTPATTKVAKAGEHKWPAFVPGNPVFPEPKAPEPPDPITPPEKPAEKPDARGNLNKLLDAIGEKDQGQAETPTKPVEPVDGSTLLAGAPDFLEVRRDYLVYSKDADKPFSGKSILYKIVQEPTGEFSDGQPVTVNIPYKLFEGEFANGRREGMGVEYYPDGNRKYVGVFKGGVLHDGWVYWYFVGTAQLKMKANFQNGQIVSSQIWNRDGSLRW